MNKQTQIIDEIKTAAGIVDGRLNGVYVYFSVKEMYERTGSSVWNRKPSGRYQINVATPSFNRRDAIFRTKVKDGSYDLAGVVSALKTLAAANLEELKRGLAREANKDVAKDIREAYPLKQSYVSSYVGSCGSFCAPANVEGLVSVQIHFGNVTPEMAEKILAFAKSLEA